MNHNEDSYTQHLVDEEKRLLVLEQKVESLTEKVEKMETSVRGLVEAWNTASGVVSFVKWLSGIATAVLAIVAFVKLGATK